MCFLWCTWSCKLLISHASEKLARRRTRFQLPSLPHPPSGNKLEAPLLIIEYGPLWCCVNAFSHLPPKLLHSFNLAIDSDQGMQLKFRFCDNLTSELASTVSLRHKLLTYCILDWMIASYSLQAFVNDSYWNFPDTIHYIIPVQGTSPKCSCFSHQKKSWADKLPAQPPIESWLKAHHPFNVFAEAVHTWREHDKQRGKDYLGDFGYAHSTSNQCRLQQVLCVK